MGPLDNALKEYLPFLGYHGGSEMTIGEQCRPHTSEKLGRKTLPLSRVHVDSWRSTYRGIVPDGFLAEMSYEYFEDRWRGWLRNVGEPRWAYRVAELPPGRIVGFASGGPRQGPPYTDYAGELYTLYLLRDHQRAGIGQRLLGSVARGLAEGGTYSLLAWVLARNPSRRFYEAVGGELLGSQEIEIGGARLEEVAYGWLRLHSLG